MLAFSSEPPRLVDTARKQWGLSFRVVSDPLNALALHLRAQRLIPDLFISDHRPGSCLTPAQRRFFSNHPFMRHYARGCTQPTLAIIRRDRTAAFSMAVTPTVLNGMGAAGRPDVTQVWAAFEQLEDSCGRGFVSKEGLRAQSVLDESYIRVLLGLHLAGFALVALWAMNCLSSTTVLAVAAVVCLVALDQWRRTPMAHLGALIGGSQASQLAAIGRFTAAFILTAFSDAVSSASALCGRLPFIPPGACRGDRSMQRGASAAS